MNIYVSDNSKTTEEYYKMKGERNDIVLEVDGIYYELSFMYFENLRQYCDNGIYIYMKNVFPVDDISINNIVKNLKINVEEKTYKYLISGTNFNVTKWVKVFWFFYFLYLRLYLYELHHVKGIRKDFLDVAQIQKTGHILFHKIYGYKDFINIRTLAEFSSKIR